MKGGGLHQAIVRGVAAQDAQATAEYAVILALIAAVAVVGYQALGGGVLDLFRSVVDAF